jgi:hypothetical protein
MIVKITTGFGKLKKSKLVKLKKLSRNSFPSNLMITSRLSLKVII